MHVVIVSGMSGSGKSQVLRTLEDQGYNCIDNLPLDLLESVFSPGRQLVKEKIAIGLDVRGGKQLLPMLATTVSRLKERFRTDLVYLYASKSVLIKRYDETRRKHPLYNKQITLKEAIVQEYEALAPIRAIADIQIDTSNMDIYKLASLVKSRICDASDESLSLLIQSFGFKYGTPRDSDFVFDVRCLQNPYWEPELRLHSGKETPVIEWLKKQELVNQMFTDLKHMIEYWVPHFIASHRAYLTVSIGCTGGHHRSVYLVERLADYFRQPTQQHLHDSIIVHHRELED